MNPEKMPAGEPDGPDSEVFFDFGEKLQLHEKSPWRNEKCHPNCDCGRFMEIGNSVFMQYQKQEDGSIKELPQKNVDFGGGLERICAASNETQDVFTIDTFAQTGIKIPTNRGAATLFNTPAIFALPACVGTLSYTELFEAGSEAIVASVNSATGVVTIPAQTLPSGTGRYYYYVTCTVLGVPTVIATMGATMLMIPEAKFI
jgi:hypothetical protein